MSALAPEPPRPSACPNCGHAFAGPAPKFCPECGQETHVKPPTVGEFLQQFGGAYLSTEGALWRTLKLLLFKPGELTRQYLAGRRKHYVLPLRLYLTVSLLVLLLLRGLATVAINAPDANKLDRGDRPLNMSLTLGPGLGNAGLKNGVFFCNDMPQWLCKRLQRRIDIKPEAFSDAVVQLSERFVANLGAALFVLLPSFALFMKMVYRSRRLRYTEHLVFGLHVHAFWFLMVALTLLPLGGIEDLALLVIPVYTMRAMKRVYGGGFIWRALRASVVSLLYLMVLSLAMAGVGLWALLG
jgi:Protein of unknown function (DUF3667)